jgi:DNA-binding MarR family transcriptional regulator
VPAAAQSTDLETQKQVLRQFRIIFNAVRTHFRQVEKKVGVGGAQLWALSLIHEHPGIGISELAHGMDIHQSTASNLIKALIAQGLVSHSRSTTDRRAVALHLMPAAVKLIAKAPGPFAGVLPDALAKIDSETLVRLDQDLASLIALLGTDAQAGQTPLGQI